MRRLCSLFVVGLFTLLSVASSHEGGEASACGELLEGAAEGEACTERSECAEVCCFCEDAEAGFAAQGCDLDNGVCLGGDALCQAALDDDPSLCASGEGEGEGEG